MHLGGSKHGDRGWGMNEICTALCICCSSGINFRNYYPKLQFRRSGTSGHSNKEDCRRMNQAPKMRGFEAGFIVEEVTTTTELKVISECWVRVTGSSNWSPSNWAWGYAAFELQARTGKRQNFRAEVPRQQTIQNRMCPVNEPAFERLWVEYVGFQIPAPWIAPTLKPKVRTFPRLKSGNFLPKGFIPGKEYRFHGPVRS